MQAQECARPKTMDEVERIAEEKLAKYGIADIPVDPVQIASLVGADVYYANFGNPDVSGLLRKESDKISIFVKSTDIDTRQRFTVAHELGHLFLHLDGQEGNFIDMYRTVNVTQTVDFRETEANHFAAALLMPRRQVEAELKYGDSVADLALSFGVSLQAMTVRLRNLANLR